MHICMVSLGIFWIECEAQGARVRSTDVLITRGTRTAESVYNITIHVRGLRSPRCSDVGIPVGFTHDQNRRCQRSESCSPAPRSRSRRWTDAMDCRRPSTINDRCPRRADEVSLLSPVDCPSLSLDYLPPTSIEILPLVLLPDAGRELVLEAGEDFDTDFTIFQSISMYTWSTWVSISRAFTALAMEKLHRIPFYAVELSSCPPFTNNTPYERVEQWQRINPTDLDELEGEVSVEEKLRWIQIRLRRARELEARVAKAEALDATIKRLTRCGLPTAAEQRELLLTALTADEAKELRQLQQQRPRLLNLRRVLLDARHSEGFEGIVVGVDDRWPRVLGWLGCKAS